jgi:predicted transcriptional regulator of viral defense system
MSQEAIRDTQQFTPSEQRVLEEVRRRGGYIRNSDVIEAHIRPHALTRLVERGLLERVRRGLYRDANLIASDTGVADVAAATTRGVICLLSALSHYHLTTTTPWEVFLALPRSSSRPPTMDYPPIHVVYYNEAMYPYGIRTERLSNGISVPMYSPEKSIADAFHFQNHVGRDVAVEAIKEYFRRSKPNVRELTEAARVCRVSDEIRPFIEALI